MIINQFDWVYRHRHIVKRACDHPEVLTFGTVWPRERPWPTRKRLELHAYGVVVVFDPLEWTTSVGINILVRTAVSALSFTERFKRKVRILMDQWKR